MRNRFKSVRFQATESVWAKLCEAGLMKAYSAQQQEILIAFVKNAHARINGALDGRLMRNPDSSQFGLVKIEIELMHHKVKYRVPLLSDCRFKPALECVTGELPTLVLEPHDMVQTELESYFTALGIEWALAFDHFGPEPRRHTFKGKFPEIGVVVVEIVG